MLDYINITAKIASLMELGQLRKGLQLSEAGPCRCFPSSSLTALGMLFLAESEANTAVYPATIGSRYGKDGTCGGETHPRPSCQLWTWPNPNSSLLWHCMAVLQKFTECYQLAIMEWGDRWLIPSSNVITHVCNADPCAGDLRGPVG